MNSRLMTMGGGAAAMLLAMLVSACAGSETAPLEIEGVRAVILENIDIIEAGINGEDVFLASQPVGAQFTMDNNVAVRYASEWKEVGTGAFRNFWSGVFISDANIEFTLELSGLELVGDIATAHCSSDYKSQRPDIVPPEVRVSTDSDYLQFERVRGQWLLRRWELRTDEDPPVEAEDGGESTDGGENGDGGEAGAA
ncbi:MAG: hypothetical protein R3F46_08005 [bacterium]